MPIPWGSAYHKPVHIFQSQTIVIRRGFCYSIDLQVVALPALRSPLGTLPLQEPPDIPTKKTTTSTNAPRAHAKRYRGPENRPRKKLNSKRMSDKDHTGTVARLSEQTTPLRAEFTASGSVRRSRMSKRARIIWLMQRRHGASLKEITEASGWQPHSVRAFISNLAKKDGMEIRSAKNERGERVYTIGNSPKR